ncbi:11693_t:CDS:2 [Acaulospora colombiana]|uniref:11693_t:CDS:1 n=1 Tax=Acaulospora colombiana TaxID=27376 RepID=A0ACA9M304_9GLOM|nr:11693_t:CDS:2 [Acaulospora colombiana]
MESIISALAQSGKLNKNAVSLSPARTNDLSSPDSQPTSLESFHNSPYVSGTDEESSGESNESQSDVSEGGHLTMDKAGHTRYVGCSSGIFLLKYAKKIVDHQVTVVCDDFHPPKRLSNRDIISELPPKNVCDQLLDLFWEKFSFYHPFIDRQDFMEKYDSMNINYNYIVLLYAILAVVSNNIASVNYYDRTRELLGEELGNSTLPTVQALLLLAGLQKGMRSSSCWVYVGLAIRLAQDMGLHRDSSNWDLDKSQAEVRRRVWWACVTFDSFLSLALGRPLAINEQDYDVRYPAAGILFYDQPESIEVFVQHIKICLITCRISKHVYGIDSKRTGGNNSILSTLDAELNEWRDNLPTRFQYDRFKKLSDDPHSITPILFNLAFYSIQIILHRPYIRCPKSKAPPSSIPSLTICTVAASSITHLMYRLMKNGILSHGWRYAHHAFFTAVTMHIINVLSDDERFREVAKQGLRMSVKCLEHLKSYLKEAERFLFILKDLLKFKNINLDGSDDKIPNKNASETEGKGSVNDDKYQHRTLLCHLDDAGAISYDKPLEMPRVTFAPPSPQPIAQEQSSRASNNAMSYEITSSEESLAFIPSTQFNESNGFNGFNELFPQNADAFIPETSSLLFDDGSNHYSLLFPNTVDLMEWSNWTEYMLKLQLSRNNLQQ